MAPIPKGYYAEDSPNGPVRHLAGPADADAFRVEVGRYGDRWYTDPLPACEIAPASEATWPSVSTVKKASGSDWTFVGLKRVATALESNPKRLEGLSFDERIEVLNGINKAGLKSAAARGTSVHQMTEDMLKGRKPVVPDNDPAAAYLPALEEFFAKYQPKLIAAEFVVIDRDLNGVGYGGTSDSLVEVNSKRYILDWKSRGEDSKHGAYAEEAAQVGSYARGQYAILSGKNGAVRRRITKLDGALIISVKPSGCRPFPIDIDEAYKHWTAMHSWWVARRSERESIGRQWAQAA